MGGRSARDEIKKMPVEELSGHWRCTQESKEGRTVKDFNVPRRKLIITQGKSHQLNKVP
jgi:hypothetical protein